MMSADEFQHRSFGLAAGDPADLALLAAFDAAGDYAGIVVFKQGDPVCMIPVVPVPPDVTWWVPE